MSRTPRSRRWIAAIAAAPLVLSAAPTLAGAAPSDADAPVPAQCPGDGYTLTLLHNNDGESQLISASGQPDFGGVARFKTLLDDLRTAGEETGPTIVVNGGDNLLPGPEFAASLDKGAPFYDSIALDAFGIDVVGVGNHDFDFGPELFADFLSGFSEGTEFASANLDYSGEPSLVEYTENGTLVESTVVEKDGLQIGVVGLTTPLLPAISSPRNVVVDPDLAGVAQGQIDALEADGVTTVVLVSHLQSIVNEQALVPELSGVDISVSAGGGELQANEDTVLIPGDERAVDPVTEEPLDYPLIVENADGDEVPIVTTSGDYKYVGRLVVDVDCDGTVTAVGDDSGPVRVSGTGEDAVEPDAELQATVTDPVAAYVETLGENIVATSEVDLDGQRASVRTRETNLGNVLADALLWSGTKNAPDFNVEVPDVAIQNSGGIRNESVIPAGDISELTTFDVAPFSNFVAVVPDVPREQFKEILENLVRSAPNQDGRFGQIAGFEFVYDPSQQAQEVDNDGNVLTPGERIVSATLDDGTVVIEDGQVLEGDGIGIATNDFSARGGDQYPFRGAPFTIVGATYQEALNGYLEDEDGLGGVISAEQYPEGGSGRITTGDLVTVVEQVFGANRYATAALVALSYGEADHVYLASGRQYADALSAASPAVGSESPILLTRPDRLSNDAAAAIAELGATQVTVLGGDRAIDDDVLDAVNALEGVQAERLFGDNRYETAIELAEAGGLQTDGTVYVASGEDYADALTAGAIAGDAGVPVLLTRGSVLTGVTAEALTEWDPQRIIVLGGTEAIEPQVFRGLAAIAPTSRIAGDQRYDTAARLAASKPSYDHVLIASGQTWPDALAASARAGVDGLPVLLTQKTFVPEDTVTELARSTAGTATVLGGPDVVAQTALDQVEAVLLGAE